MIRLAAATALLVGCEPYVVGERAELALSGCQEQLTGLGASAEGNGLSRGAPGVACERVSIGPDGTVYAGWGDKSSGKYEVYLTRWNGQAWSGLGGSERAGGLSQGTGSAAENGYRSCLGQVGFDAQGAPIVAWANYDGTQQGILVSRWTGAAWLPFGPSGSGTGVATTQFNWWPGLISAGPTVVWSWASQVHLAQWSSTAWEGLGGSSTSPGLADGPTLGVAVVAGASLDDLTVAWAQQDADGGAGVIVRSWNGATWATLGEPPGEERVPHSELADQALLGRDRAGGVLLAWHESSLDGGTDVQLRRWDGAHWSGWGASMSVREAGLSTAPRRPSLAVGGDDVYLAWEEDAPQGTAVVVARWHDAEFERCGRTGSSASPQSTWPAVAADEAGRFAVAWLEEGDAGAQVYLEQGKLVVPAPAPPGSYAIFTTCSTVPGTGIGGLVLLAATRRRRHCATLRSTPPLSGRG